MSAMFDADERKRHPLRAAVFAAALAVAGCFTAAFTFADDPSPAPAANKGR